MQKNSKNEESTFMENKNKVLEIAKELKENGLLTPITQRLLIAAIANPIDANLSVLNSYSKPQINAVKNSTSPFPKPNLGDNIDGAINIGKTETGLPCGLNIDDQHCLISGLTGCGKTVLLIYIILAQLLQKENNENI